MELSHPEDQSKLFETSMSIFSDSHLLLDWNEGFETEFQNSLDSIFVHSSLKIIASNHFEESDLDPQFLYLLYSGMGEERTFRYVQDNLVIEVNEYKTVSKQIIRTARIISTKGLDSDVEVASLHSSNSIFSLKRKTQNELRIAKEAAEANRRAKNYFLAAMSHELRTPMNGIINMSKLILQNNPDESLEEMATTILNSGTTLMSLIDDIQDISRLESGSFRLETTDFDLVESIESLLILVYPRIKEKSLNFSLSIEPNARNHFRGDIKRIKQILLNLIGNSIKFTNKGYIKIQIKDLQKEKSDLRFIQFIVKDSGIGIDESLKSKVFENFYQADLSHSRSFGGVGIGLSISKHIIQLMKGNIDYTSELNNGSTFFFEIPLQKVSLLNANKWGNVRHQPINRILIIKEKLNNVEHLFNQLNSINVLPSLVDDLKSVPYRNNYNHIFIDHNLIQDDIDSFKELLSNLENKDSTHFIIVFTGYHSSIKEFYKLLSINFSIISDLYLLKDIFYLNELKQESSNFNTPTLATKVLEPGGTKNIKVLVAEDVKVNQIIMKKYLTKSGLDHLIVENGELAYQEFLNFKYDIILMDIQMPVMDGLTATKMIRESNSPNSNIPIIAVTADAMSGASEYYLNNGFNEYIAKPINFDLLIEKIFELTSKRMYSTE